MTRQDMLLMLDQIVEVEPGTLSESDSLASIDGWDSLAVIVFQAEVDEKLGTVSQPADLARCKTVRDLIDLVDDQLTAA
jgi:acyl carrier protein